jgi:hypothetical protein
VFDPIPDCVGVMVDEVALVQDLVRVLQLSRVSIIPPVICTYLHFKAMLIRKTIGHSIITIRENIALADIERALGRKIPIHCEVLFAFV